MRYLSVVLALVLAALSPLPGAAQDVKMERTPFERELRIIPPTTEPARSRPEDADYYPNTGGIIHEPAFFERLSTQTESGGRFGIAGWSSPNSPVGADYSEINGWLSFGFAFTWSSPPLAPPKKPAPR